MFKNNKLQAENKKGQAPFFYAFCRNGQSRENKLCLLFVLFAAELKLQLFTPMRCLCIKSF